MMAEASVRARVVVTFLRMVRPPAEPAPRLPEGMRVRRLPECPVATYRWLYDQVGGEYLWWLRRIMPDRQLAALLRHPAISIYVLEEADGQVAGFFELDASSWPSVNLNYFGLMPHAIGRGLGLAFLRAAVDEVWRRGARAMTVNTCTADHPRALPTYLKAGFEKVRTASEEWDIPLRLGLTVPDRLRVEPR